MVQYWEESGQSQAGGSARARVKAGCADPLAGRWLARRSSRRLWSSEGLAEGGPGKPRPPYGGGIMALWGGRCPGGKGRGGSPRGTKNSGGTSRIPSGPNGGPRPDQTKRNTRFSDALKMNIPKSLNRTVTSD